MDGKRVVIVALAVALAAAALRERGAPPIRTLAGIAAAGTMLAFLAEVNPDLAGQLAALLCVGLIFANGAEIATGVVALLGTSPTPGTGGAGTSTSRPL